MPIFLSGHSLILLMRAYYKSLLLHIFKGPIRAYCAEPYTRRISTTKRTKKLRIHFNITSTNNQQHQKSPAIDAVQLTSEQRLRLDTEECARCEKLQLRYEYIILYIRCFSSIFYILSRADLDINIDVWREF